MDEEKKSILAIDDDITVLTAIRKILEEQYEVSLAKSAEVALNILSNTSIDLILLDVEMPSISGLAFMDFLKENKAFQYIPVIFVTSHAQPDIILKAKNAGAKGFIAKPLSRDLFLEKVNAVIKESEPLSERNLLLKKLHLLEIACKTGKNTQVTTLTDELIKIHYNVGTDGKIVEICRYASKLDYAPALEKIGALIKNNFYDR
jgi:response regulator RpfG family c-di-GMP phosphodiesterase